MARQRPLKILFVPGPGAVHETWAFWRDGGEDIWNPAIPYSQQVYDITRQIDCDMLVLSEQPVPADDAGPIRFAVHKSRGGRGLAFHVNEIVYTFGILAWAIRHRSNAVIIQRQPAHFWPLAVLPRLGVTILASFHNTFWTAGLPPPRRARFYARVNRPFFRSCRLLLCVSDVVKQQVIMAAGADRADRIEVHVPQYAEETRARWQPVAAGHQPTHLLYLGRVEADKGVFLLLAAFETLCAQFEGLKLTYVGDGTGLASLQARIAQSAFADQITAKGRTDGAGVYDALAAADLLVCPTTSRFSEGLAKTPIEATLSGIPSIVTTNVPVGTVLAESAVVVAPDDADAIATAVADLIRSPGRYKIMADATQDLRAQFFDRTKSFGHLLLAQLRQLSD